ncbi:hypothetical protein C2845_PM05G06190 [Panicum miliaceum]|uniref:NAC domain-containing protein n=1 Tax=Panicum miliaceum TaxID=4540 RepID=A0A3L6SX95_PANMI|nr:hypothetical protein C2845_PM05G06190 [Panicum miliaceum]
MASLGPEIFSRGFRLNPTPLEAATYYLPQLLAGALLHESIRPFIHHADVYACEPGVLARQFRPLPRTGHRFFFTHCKLQRAAEGGEGRQGRARRRSRIVALAGRDGRRGPRGSEGRRDEEAAVQEGRRVHGLAHGRVLVCLQDTVVGDRRCVFCNIYVSPRAATGSAARQESAAFFAPPAPAEPKRPAPQVAESPCPRMRGAAPTPPVVQPAAGCAAYFAPPRPCVPNRAVAPPSTPSRGSSVDSLSDQIVAGLISASGASSDPSCSAAVSHTSARATAAAWAA